MSAAQKPAGKLVKLQANTAGGWRDVLTFDADEKGDAVLEAADTLFRLAADHILKGRVIIPGDTAPLMSWTVADGWKTWRHPAS